jgi:hypothetical protein
MKVIKPGRPQKGWSIEAVCTGHRNNLGGCGAILLVEQADVFTTESHSYDETNVYNTFKCPQCGVLTDFSTETSLPFKPPSQQAWDKLRATVERFT